MKSERRHELRTNTLAVSLGGFPEFIRQHGGQIVTLLAVAVLAYSIVRWRMQTISQHQLENATSLTELRNDVNFLGSWYGQSVANGLTDQQRAVERNAAVEAAQNAYEKLDSQGKDLDEAFRAEAYLQHANLNWTLANLPQLPGAATQPALSLRQSNADLLTAAQRDYQAVVDNFPDMPVIRAKAMFGLAAIDENLQNWDAAKARYQKIADDSAIPSTLRDAATASASHVDSLRNPEFFGYYPPRPAATQPCTAPALSPQMGPFAPEMPAIPATRPATNP